MENARKELDKSAQTVEFEVKDKSINDELKGMDSNKINEFVNRLRSAILPPYENPLPPLMGQDISTEEKIAKYKDNRRELQTITYVNHAITDFFRRDDLSKIIAGSVGESLANLKNLLLDRISEIRQSKELALTRVLEQTKTLESTWRGLELAYRNGISSKSKKCNFYLINISKETLRKEFERSRQLSRDSIIEFHLRDNADRFGGSPFAAVILPFQVEADDINFFRSLGRIGREWRTSIIADMGATLLKAQGFPKNSNDFVERLRDEDNQIWKRLVEANNDKEELEALSYLSLMVPSIAVRKPYEFQRRQIEIYLNNEDKFWNDCVLWGSASYAMLGGLSRLASEYGTHMTPGGKGYGTLDLAVQSDIPGSSYRNVDSQNAPKYWPLSVDLLKGNANLLVDNGLSLLVKFVDTGEISNYGECTLASFDPNFRSLGVRLTHDYILHYCNRYLEKFIGSPKNETRQKIKTGLNAFLSDNTGKINERPLEDFNVDITDDPEDAFSLLVNIEIQVKRMIRKISVNLRVKHEHAGEAGGVEEIMAK